MMARVIQSSPLLTLFAQTCSIGTNAGDKADVFAARNNHEVVRLKNLDLRWTCGIRKLRSS